MSPLDILERTRRRPFEPFRLVVSDGSVYEVSHPELCAVAQTTVTVTAPSQPGVPPDEDYHLLDAFHIVKLILLAKPAGGAGLNGVPASE